PVQPGLVRSRPRICRLERPDRLNPITKAHHGGNKASSIRGAVNQPFLQLHNVSPFPIMRKRIQDFERAMVYVRAWVIIAEVLAIGERMVKIEDCPTSRPSCRWSRSHPMAGRCRKRS